MKIKTTGELKLNDCPVYNHGIRGKVRFILKQEAVTWIDVVPKKLLAYTVQASLLDKTR